MTIVRHTIHTLGPLSHGDLGADTGNVGRFRRIPIASVAGPLPIPALSAGALRGVVRRALWREVFDELGMSRETVDGWDRLYAALANGGTIESSETRVSPDAIRARRRAMPVLSLLGAALYSSHMAGRAKVSNSWLQCRELGVDAPPMRDLLADETRVRHVDREEQDPDVSTVGPMPTTTETVITGARLCGHASIASPLEASAWAHGLDLITHLGGKSGQGYGEVRIDHDGDGSAYVAWLSERRGQLKDALLKMAAELAGGKKAKKARPDPAPEPADTTSSLF